MILFVIFCVQIFLIQHAFPQTVPASAVVTNSLPSNFGPNAGLPQPISGPNLGLSGPNIAFPNAGLSGQLLGALQAPGYGPLGPQAFGLPPTQPIGPIGNQFAAYNGVYGGNGNGDVSVVGELPVSGTTAISGQVPLSGKVQFTGSVPASGLVTISGQCACGCNGPYNAGYPAKPVYNNKPYIY